MKLVYNIDFGITAAVFLVVLYTYVKLQYSSYSEVNRTFQKVVVITLIADVLDVLTAITISYGSQVPIFFNTVLNTLYYICVACMEFYFFLYFDLCVHGKHNSKSILFLVDQIGFVCYFIAVILNARFGYFFSFNEQGEYVHGVCYPLVFVVPYFFIVCALAVLIQGFQKFTFRQKVSIFVYLFTACMGPFLQLFVFPGVLLANFTLALGIVMILFSMETPDYQKLMETMTELDETRKEAEQAREEAIKASMAKSGAEALELAEKDRYDLILMDHMMPEMDGIETLQKIREGSTSNKQTPIVVLTANAIAGEKEKYLAAGFIDYLSKPVRGKELEKMVMKYLPQKLIK